MGRGVYGPHSPVRLYRFFWRGDWSVESAPDPEHYERWRDALNHVFTPRLFFPDKAALSDTDVFERRALGGQSDEEHVGTSISIGHMAENFIDFGFPGMLLPMLGMGLLLGGMARYFMTRPVAWAAREGFALACIMTVSPGVEIVIGQVFGRYAHDVRGARHLPEVCLPTDCPLGSVIARASPIGTTLAKSPACGLNEFVGHPL